MAKTKKKKGLADKVRHSNKNKKSKGTLDKVRNNPFEIKVNKQKHTILGRKTKHDRGLPGVTRSKAIKKRKETLLQEWTQRHKSNSIKDERFGIGDKEVSVEEKMLERFTLERKKKHEKMAQFNLNEEEELTHLGQSLSTLDQFDDFEQSDNEDERGIISSEYVENAHFGGGIFTKKTDEEEEGEGDDRKSRKDVIDEIIAKSKQAKYEKQANKDKDDELRDKLDSSWKDFEKLLKGKTRTNYDKNRAKDEFEPDEYDTYVRQMMFESKAAPAQKSKSEYELALEREEELKKLGEERDERMKMNSLNNLVKKVNHQSADALIDEFAPKEEIPEVEPLSYLIEDEEGEDKEENEKLEEEKEDSNNEVHEDSDSDLGDQGIEEDEEMNDEDADSDDYSDIDSGNEDDLESFVESVSSVRSSPEKNAQIEDKQLEKREIKKFPGSYSEFTSLLQNNEVDSAPNLTETLRKNFAPSVAKGNKAKMVELFAYIWQHCCEMATLQPPRIKVIDSLTKDLFELCSLNVNSCSACVQQRLKISFHLCFTSSKIKPSWPTLDVLIQFKLIKLLFSTSDFIHPVTTPAILFMCDLLSTCKVLTISDICKGLMTCTLVYEYVCYSKRFVPECLNFLVTTLCMAIPRNQQLKTVIPEISSRYLNRKTCDILCYSSDVDLNKIEKVDIFQLICKESYSDKEKCLLILTTIRLLQKFATLYSDITAYTEIFQPFKQLLSTIKNITKEKIILTEIENVFQVINDNCGKLRTPCSFGVEKPTILRLFDPKIEDVGEPFERKSKKKNSLKRERERLLHKHKREKKGAIREIRKDSKFIARQKFKEQQEMDTERAEKVKRLYGLLSNQEGEVKNIQRKKYKLDI